MVMVMVVMVVMLLLLVLLVVMLLVMPPVVMPPPLLRCYCHCYSTDAAALLCCDRQPQRYRCPTNPTTSSLHAPPPCTTSMHNLHALYLHLCHIRPQPTANIADPRSAQLQDCLRYHRHRILARAVGAHLISEYTHLASAPIHGSMLIVILMPACMSYCQPRYCSAHKLETSLSHRYISRRRARARCVRAIAPPRACRPPALVRRPGRQKCSGTSRRRPRPLGPLPRLLESLL